MPEDVCEPITRPPCFTCVYEAGREDTHALSSDGYVSRGVLKRLLLKLDPFPACFETDTVDIFGFSWVTETALVESTKLLFGLFRQKVFRLETLVQSSSHDFGKHGLHYEAEELRQQCVLFLSYIKVFIHRFLDVSQPMDEGFVHPYSELEAKFPSSLVEELFGITLLIGRLKDLPANVQSALTIHHQGKLFPPSWHLLHLHLDVHWAVLEILHLLGQKTMGQVVYAHQFVDLTGETLTNISLFEDHLKNLLCDLIGLRLKCFLGSVPPGERLLTAIHHHHFYCICTKELWILLIHLLEHRSKTLHSQVNTLALIMQLGKSPLISVRLHSVRLPAHCKDPLGFTWWFLTHIAQLGMHSRNGSLQSEKQMEDNWSFVLELLKSSCDLKEEQVRMHVHCCLSLSLLWGTNTSAVNTLWEYYSKNLNGSFSVPWLGVSGLGSISPTPLTLLEQAKNCCSPDPVTSASHLQLYRSANSFLIFLRMLALHLNQDSAPGAPWRQIKGRIYSKFHARRMAELSDSGLHHFLLLFLVLARCGDLEDAAGRASDLLTLLVPGSVSPTLCALQWRGQLALLLLFGGHGLDLAPLASKLSSSFTNAAREFYLKTTEPARRAALWQPLSAYLEGAAELWQTSTTLCQSEEALLGEGFGLLLPACRTSELNTALSFLLTALTQLRSVQQRFKQLGPSDCPSWAPPPSVVKERHLAVAVALWTHFFPFLRSLRLSQTPPPQLADAATGFTLLALDMPNSAPQDLQPHPLQSVMNSFGWDEMLCPLLVTRYLSNLLQNGELVGWMGSGSGSGSAQALCVRAWIRCVLQQHLHKTPDNSRSIGRVYSSLQLLSERSSLVCKALEYLGDVLKFIKPYLLNRSSDGLHLTYWTLGCVVKQWSPLLATTKGQPLLLRIVDVLLLPRSLLQQDKAPSTQDKTPPTQVLSALKETLPLYLQGLSIAASVSQTQGVYLRQQLRNVIVQYLSRFLPATPTAGAVANHPVLLSGCEATPSPRGAVLRKTIMDNFLQFKGHAPPPRLAAVLSFQLELLRRNNDSDPDLLTVTLPPVLRCLMLVNEPQVKRLSADCLQLMVERCLSAAGDQPCEQLISVFRTFVEENEGVYELQVYSVLETVAILSPSTVSTLIPDLSRCMRNTEQKRGLGRNISLRNGYKSLLALLGEAGQAELVSLEAD
uniref:Protein MMS22-like n=1 Tax=Astyanax mexicanus TaxID=7994 RepID=A0A8B9LW64_ASTMX